MPLHRYETRLFSKLLLLTYMYTENNYIQSQYCSWGKVYITFCLYWFTFIMSDIKYMNFKQYRITSKLKFQNSYFCQTFCNKATFFFKLSAIVNRFMSEQDKECKSILHVSKNTMHYLIAPSDTVSSFSTFPPNPFHLPSPNPFFLSPRRREFGLRTMASVRIFRLVNI